MERLINRIVRQKRAKAWEEYSRARWVQELAFDTSLEFLHLGCAQRRGMLGLAAKSMRKTNEMLAEYKACAEELGSNIYY